MSFDLILDCSDKILVDSCSDDISKEKKAIDDLVSHVQTLVVHLGPWPSAPRIALHGGLIDLSGPLHDDLIVALERLDCVIFEGKVDGARGACRMAKFIQSNENNDLSLGVFP